MDINCFLSCKILLYKSFCYGNFEYASKIDLFIIICIRTDCMLNKNSEATWKSISRDQRPYCIFLTVLKTLIRARRSSAC